MNFKRNSVFSVSSCEKGARDLPLAPRRRHELLERDLEDVRHAIQDRQRGVRGAGLEARPGGAGHLCEVRHLLLREPARLAELADVSTQAGRDLGLHAIPITILQCIGTVDDTPERRRHGWEAKERQPW